MLEFPRRLMHARETSFNLSGRVVSAGQSAGGVVPVTDFSGGGFWVGELDGIPLRTLDDVRAWRAFRSAASGGSRPFIAYRCDILKPWPVVDGVRVTSHSVPHSDDTPHSDDAPYGQGVIEIVTVGEAALRATTLTLRLDFASALRGGEAFSIEHPVHSWRMYEIETVTIDGAGNSVVTIAPPLREATPAGTRCHFDLPRCIMRAATPDALDLRVGHKGPFAWQSARMIEAFPPFP